MIKSGDKFPSVPAKYIDADGAADTTSSGGPATFLALEASKSTINA
ncbi:MAG: hypothetical protein ACYCZU_01880 [Devosia sp.]